MAGTLKLEIVTAEGPVYSEDVEMVTLPGITGQFGVYPQHVPLIAQMVPGEMIVRKDGHDIYFATGAGLIEVRAMSVAILTDLAVQANKITKSRPKKPGNVPKRGSKINSPTKKSPTSTPRWLAPWRSCTSSADNAHKVECPLCCACDHGMESILTRCEADMFHCKTCGLPVEVKADGQDQKVIGHPYYDSISIKIVDDYSIEETDKKAGKTG